MRKHLCIAAVLFATLGAASADPPSFKDGLAAYDAKQYQVAYWSWITLADQGDAKAQWGVGHLLHAGLGVPKDAAKGAGYLQRSAEQGVPLALHELGVMNASGDGVLQSATLAYVYFELAVERGMDEGQGDATLLKSLLDADELRDAEQQLVGWRSTLNLPAR